MADGSFLHAEGEAKWDASPALLAFLEQTLRPGWRTAETGAGRSTLLFAAKGCSHDVVTPSASEKAAIQAAARAEGVAMAAVTFHIGYSQDVLPQLAGPDEDLDLVFIDGGHGFPIPAVDFQYLAPRLKVGGWLLIDDVDLWTGAMIVDVLKRDPAWAHHATFKGRTACFRKTAPFVNHEWTKQPTVVAKSFWPQTWRKLRNGLALLLKGDVAGVAGKLANEKKLAEAAKRDA
jgi:hypothetical protein